MVDHLFGLVNLSCKKDCGFLELWSGLDGLDVVVDDVSLVGGHDAVETDAFCHDRGRDVFVLHLASLSLELVVGLASCLVDVVLDNFLLVKAIVALEGGFADE